MTSKRSDKDHDQFHFTLQHVLRIGLFLTLVFILINYFASQNQAPASDDPTVLGEEVEAKPSLNLKQISDSVYLSLPPESQQIIKNIHLHPAIINSQQYIRQAQDQLDGFPGKQVKQLQKEMLRRLYQNALDSLEK